MPLGWQYIDDEFHNYEKLYDAFYGILSVTKTLDDSNYYSRAKVKFIDQMVVYNFSGKLVKKVIN